MHHYFKYTFICGYAIIALACSHSSEPRGKATLSGKFSGSFPAGEIYTVKITVPNLVIGDTQQFDEYETLLALNGNFSLSIPLFSSVYALCSINEEEYGAFFLSPDKETKIELSLNEKNEMQVKLKEGQTLTQVEINKLNESVMKFMYKLFDTENSLSGLRWDMSPETYKDYFLKWTEKQLSIVEENKNISEEIKQLLYVQIKWATYIGLLFDYEGQVRYIYDQQSGERGDDTIFTPVKPAKSYYSFLRFFDLNNPPKFASPSYSSIYKYILDNEVLNIPSIGNQAVSDWLKEVKPILSPLIGSDTGLCYDFLVFHAYLQQLADTFKPFSDKQKEEIKAYFRNPAFAEFLYIKNEETIQQVQLSSIINETPAVEKEVLMDAIVSKYKGKVVLVDFWATWCGPCLEAIYEFKEIKHEMEDKGVVFVYITDTSSPKGIWEKKISKMGGEHYYLTEEESKYIHKEFGFMYIPSYVLYDAEGRLKNKFTGYPGNEKMQEAIEKLLH